MCLYQNEDIVHTDRQHQERDHLQIGNYTEECRLLRYKKPSLYFTGDTLLLRYRVQPVNAM
jgi:hypothetical protein